MHIIPRPDTGSVLWLLYNNLIL